MFYLLVFLLNINNFEPVVTKSCIEYSGEKAKSEFEKEAISMMRNGFSCEKNPDTLVYNCQNQKAGVIGKITVLKNKKECKSFPKTFAKNLKSLTGK